MNHLVVSCDAFKVPYRYCEVPRHFTIDTICLRRHRSPTSLADVARRRRSLTSLADFRPASDEKTRKHAHLEFGRQARSVSISSRLSSVKRAVWLPATRERHLHFSQQSQYAVGCVFFSLRGHACARRRGYGRRPNSIPPRRGLGQDRVVSLFISRYSREHNIGEVVIRDNVEIAP